ncbi:MAG: hypothetical protein C3L25_14245 [Candidatus Sedimenticola endophacoides]|nr:MAG: hypothetical protein C3L26_14325 [Candidatus Sedimenticola endophacoides]PUE00113.1 MAG: hypothetical protein C3L25_14245 [Candidatus Sedimenticola endophacoides]
MRDCGQDGRNLPQIIWSCTVQQVNRYVNSLDYIPDAAGQDGNRWATPDETMQRHGGDCEDLAIAKYYALRTLGVPQSQMQLVHVRISARGEEHMVLVYRDDENGRDLVLDNLTDHIGSLRDRTDLLPVYSFNHTGLWIGGQQNGKRLDPNQISKWHQLRMAYQS